MTGYWTKALSIGFVYLIISLVCGHIHPFLAVAMGLWAIPSWAFVSLIIVRKRYLRISDFFDCFTSLSRLAQFISLSFLNFVFIMLWSLLIIMGYVKFLSYLMSFFIVAENKNISVMDAIDQSQKMLTGKLCKLFGVHFVLSLGWSLYMLIILLIVIYQLEYGLLLFVYMCSLIMVWYPYYFVCLANFYESVRPINQEVDNIPEMVNNVGSFN